MSFSSSNGAAAGPEQHYTTTSSQTGQGMSSAQAAQAAPSAQQTPAKRKRDKDGNDTDSDCDGQHDPKTRPLDQQQLAELTDLTSHTNRFEFETTKMEVAGLLQWHYTDTARTSKPVYDTKYQRNQNAGWDPEKQSQFLKTVKKSNTVARMSGSVVYAGLDDVAEWDTQLTLEESWSRDEIDVDALEPWVPELESPAPGTGKHPTEYVQQ